MLYSILACLRGSPMAAWGDEILALAERFRGSDDGAVVGIDIAGDERGGINVESEFH